MSRHFVIVSLLLLAGCSTSEVYRPTTAESNPEISRDQQTAIVQSEGISIEAQIAREDNGRFRVDMVVDNHSDITIDFSMGDTHLYCNGTDLKVYSSRFMRNWSYQSASRGKFVPSESAYATISYEGSGSAAINDKLEFWIDGIIDSRNGRKIAFPRIPFGDARKERPLPGNPNPPPAHQKVKK